MGEQCRICLTLMSSLNFISVFSNFNQGKTILRCIMECSSIQVLDPDPLPKSLCYKCFSMLFQCHSFRDLILQSDRTLKEKRFSPVSPTLEQIIIDNDIKKEEILHEEQITDGLTNASSLKHTQIPIKNENSEQECSAEKPLNGISEDNLNNTCDISNTPSKTRPKFAAKPKISTHKKRKKITFQCEICEEKFKTSEHVTLHMGSKHGIKHFQCDICNNRFSRIYDLNYHKRTHSEEKPYLCEVCSRTFKSKSTLETHYQTHTGNRRHKCDLCDKSFIITNQLRIHIRQKHTGERPFLCELCSSSFSSQGALNAHIRVVHEKNESCPYCNKIFCKKTLKLHVRRHKEQEQGIKRYVCNLCGKRFTCNMSRVRHLVVHTREKNFKCGVCQKSFSQRSALVTHQKVHTGEMPFCCDVCDKRFRYKQHCKKHIERVHKKCAGPDTGQSFDVGVKNVTDSGKANKS